MKKINLLLILFLVQLTLIAQRNPLDEVLVYFSSGVTQSVCIEKGSQKKVAKISSDSLKKYLQNIGIVESMLEVAMPSFNRKDTLTVLSDNTKLRQIDMSKLYRINLSKGMSKDSIIYLLNKLQNVVYAEPNSMVNTCSTTPNDDYYNSEQWNLHNTTNPGVDIHINNVWDFYTGDPDLIIAIVDRGLDDTHIDLDDKIIGGDIGYKEGENCHGNQVAGIAAAETNNDEGIAGVDWNAKLISQRVDQGDNTDIYQAIVDAVNYSPNVKVLNNSYSLDGGEDIYGRPLYGDYSITVAQACAYAYKANRVFTAAMGNYEVYLPGEPSYPAAYENVISVGASNKQDKIWEGSAHGPHINVVAPGDSIFTTRDQDGYTRNKGTSMATPHVSGLASLLIGYKPSLCNDDVRNIIELSCNDIDYSGDQYIGPGFDQKSGYGRINADSAFTLLFSPYDLKQWNSTGGIDYSSIDTTRLMLGVQGLAPGFYIVKKHEVRKNITFPESLNRIIRAWGRGVLTNGLNKNNPIYGMGFCELVPGTLTNTEATFRTYVYQVWSYIGSYLGYYPTTPSNVNFYYTVLGILNPTLSGPSLLCSTNTTYTLEDLVPGASVNWSKSSNITIVSSNSNSCTVVSNGNGPGWVQANISGGVYQPASIRKDIDWVGRPYVNPATIQFESSEGFGYFCTNLFGNEFSFTFDHPYNYFNIKLTNLSETQTYDQFTIYDTWGTMDCSPPEGTYLFHVRGNNNCGTATNWSKKDVEYVDCGMGGLFSLEIYPNPSTEQTTITIVTKEEMNTVTKKVDEEWQLEVYTQGQLLKLNIPAIIDNKYILNTSGWKPGMYFIRVYYKDEVLWGTLIVNE